MPCCTSWHGMAMHGIPWRGMAWHGMNTCHCPWHSMANHAMTGHCSRQVVCCGALSNARAAGCVSGATNRRHLSPSLVSATQGAVPIPGAKDMAQAKENLGALGWRLRWGKACVLAWAGTSAASRRNTLGCPHSAGVFQAGMHAQVPPLGAVLAALIEPLTMQQAYGLFGQLPSHTIYQNPNPFSTECPLPLPAMARCER